MALIAFLVGGVAAPSVRAQQVGQKGIQLLSPDSIQHQVDNFKGLGKYALVIGINEYKDERIVPLRFAVADAKAVRDALVDPLRGGFLERNVVLLANEKADRVTITATLQRISEQAKAGDLVLVYFSGHGVVDADGQIYLLTAEARRDLLSATALKRTDFMQQLERIPADKVVVMLDACHSGGVTRGSKGVEEELALSTLYQQQFLSARGWGVLVSCDSNEVSYEDDAFGHGVFTMALLEAMSGLADTLPTNGLVSFRELGDYVERGVSAWATRKQKSQHPLTNLTGARGDIPLSFNHFYLELRRRERADQRGSAVRVDSLRMSRLPKAERAQVDSLMKRFASAMTPSMGDVFRLQYAQWLMDGKIGVDGYRKLIAQPLGLLNGGQIGIQPPQPPWLKRHKTALAVGVPLVAGAVVWILQRKDPPPEHSTTLPEPQRPPGS
jgi:hypothetical protein